jgi:uncharacterized protein (DUF2147 family)
MVKNIVRLLGVCLFIGLSMQTTYAENLTSPIGNWITIDDKSNQPLSTVQIYQNNETGTLEGKVIKINPILGQKVDDLCLACKGDNKNKPILGMKIMWGMLQDESDLSFWHDGHVLDPKNGSIYSAKMSLINEGCQLKLRGYIIMSWIGRSQVWNRDSTSCRSTNS